MVLSINLRLLGRSATRARIFLLGEKVAKHITERGIVNTQGLFIEIGTTMRTLYRADIHLQILTGLGLCFSSFNIYQQLYELLVGSALSVRGQRVN